MKSVYSLIAIFFFFQTIGNAQGCCSGGTPLSGNLNLSSRATRGISFRLIYDFNNLQDVVVDTKEIADKSRARINNAGLLRVDYTFNRRFTFTTLFSFIRQTERIQFGTVDNRTYGQGIGDIVLLGQYNIFQKNNIGVSIAAGVKAPTGSVKRVNASLGFLLPPDLQPGTGAWDFPAVIQFSKKEFLLKKLNLLTELSYRITGEANRFDRQQRYKFGNELQATLGGGYDFYVNRFLLTPQINLKYRNTQFDQTNGRRTPNTGGHWGYLSSGFVVDFLKKIKFGVLTDLPVYRKLDGVQLTTSYRTTASLIYNFEKGKKPVKSFGL